MSPIAFPESLITEETFERQGWEKVQEDESEGPSGYYWILPLPKDDDDVSDRPTLISIASDEWKTMELNEGEYLVTLFDNLPMLETEEEIELLYKILTKENLTK